MLWSNTGRILNPGIDDIFELYLSVYGLKYASQIFSNNVHDKLRDMAFKQCEHEQFSSGSLAKGKKQGGS